MKLNGDRGFSQPDTISGQIFTDNGTGVRVECDDFMNILSRSENPLVVFTAEGFFTKIYKYVTAYKGFIFFTESLNKLNFDKFDDQIEIIHALSLSTKI